MTSIPLNNSVSQTDFLKSIKDELFLLYQDAFLIDLFKYKVTNDSSCKSAPITIRSNKAIILNCDPTSPNQIAFQLSHELCHACIPKSVPNNLRWLEESFAVLASFLFPRKLSQINFCEYGKYFCKSFKCEIPRFQMSSPPLNDNDLKELESGSGTRNFNDYGNYYKIAKLLLPLIRNNPEIWKIIPHLCDIQPNLKFSESLENLENLVSSDIRNLVIIIEGAFLIR